VFAEQNILHLTVYGTGNFGGLDRGEELFRTMRTLQPDYPLMVMEFWAGWFDHWGEHHNDKNIQGIHPCI